MGKYNWHCWPPCKGMFYIPLLVYLYLMITEQRPDELYQCTVSVRTMFQFADYSEDGLAMDEVVTTNDLYEYYMTTLVDSIFGEVKKNGDEDVIWTADESYILIGRLRLRAQRMTNDSCKLTKEFSYNRESWSCDDKTRYIWGCVGRYHTDTIEKESLDKFWLPYDKNNKTKIFNNNSPFHYQPSTSIFETSRGKYFTYPGGGNIAELGLTKKDSIKILKNLRDSRWVDNYVRVVIAEFVLYNVDSNVFNIVKIIAERVPTRMFVLTIEDNPTRLVYFNDDISMMTLNLPICLLLLFIMMKHFLEMTTRKSFNEYITSVWTWVDIITLLSGIATLSFIVFQNSAAAKILKTFKNPKTRLDAQFLPIAGMDYLFTVSLAILLFFAIIQLWSIFFCTLRFRIISRNLINNLRDFVFYLLMLSAFLLMFATFANGLMSDQIHTFRSFHYSVLNLLSLAFGFTGIDFMEIEEVLGAFGQLFYLFFVFITKVYLINLFASIIMSQYNEVKSIYIELERREPPNAITRAFSRIARKVQMDKIKDIPVEHAIVNKLDHILLVVETSVKQHKQRKYKKKYYRS